ncbi:MAG: rhomboid family intramembrane serine protease [Clostridiales bacterium]|jgi:membrane associated rhomboid family serine protease|nr:rhomboid family intramembrane serine protease [Clostridiales bacterium]
MQQFKNALNCVQYNAPVILSFTLLSLIVYFLNELTGWANFNLFSVYRSPLTNPLGYIRLFGHVLGHVDINHYFNNFLMILLAGPMLEEKYGSKNILLMIVFTAVVTGLIHVLLFPNTVLLGASGVVFMMILLSSFVNLKKGKIPLTLIVCVIVFIGREIAGGLLQQDHISQITHILGGGCGAFFGFYLNRNRM